jgi:hypothetical protein
MLVSFWATFVGVCGVILLAAHGCGDNWTSCVAAVGITVGIWGVPSLIKRAWMKP